jgi:hypothetical protein
VVKIRVERNVVNFLCARIFMRTVGILVEMDTSEKCPDAEN